MSGEISAGEPLEGCLHSQAAISQGFEQAAGHRRVTAQPDFLQSRANSTTALKAKSARCRLLSPGFLPGIDT